MLFVVRCSGLFTFTMIIEIRYRDVPFDDIRDDIAPTRRAEYETLWTHLRARRVRILTPPTSERHCGHLCNGPFFIVVNDDDSVKYRGDNGRRVGVCSHITEIGD